jgi:uncharacterized protein
MRKSAKRFSARIPLELFRAIKPALTVSAHQRSRTPERATLGGSARAGQALSDTSKEPKSSITRALEKDWQTVGDFLREHPNLIREDSGLLADLGLWVRASNIVEFGPAALARLSAAKTREKAARRQLEATARANFAAQAQTHAAVIDLLEARNHSDLARRVDEIARLRFGLAAGVIALEIPGGVPAGWISLPADGVGDLLGQAGLARMGPPGAALALFGEQAEGVASIAMVRMAIWAPARQGALVFGSPEADGFTGDMGAELVAFLARVAERMAERWPVL